MRAVRATLLLTALVGMLAGLAFTGGFAPASGGTSPSRLVGTIAVAGTVVEHHTITGNPVGLETWRFSLTSARRSGSRPLGYAILVCSFVSTRTTIRQCAGTFSLPRGKIIVSGSFLYPTLYQLAVTGGSDLYVSVGGNLAARSYPGGRVAFAFALR